MADVVIISTFNGKLAKVEEKNLEDDEAKRRASYYSSDVNVLKAFVR